MPIPNYVQYDELTKTVSLHYREDGRSTIQTFKAADVAEAGMLTASKGWRLVGEHWEYSPLEGYTMNIERKG